MLKARLMPLTDPVGRLGLSLRDRKKGPSMRKLSSNIGFCLLLSLCGSGAPEVGNKSLSDVLRAERAALLADPTFVSGSLLMQLAAAQDSEIDSAASALGIDSGSLLAATRRTRAILEYRMRRLGEEPRDENGCFEAAGGPFEANLSRGEAPISSFEEVLLRAHTVLRGRVIAVDEGFVANRFGTLVRFEVQENLGPHFATAEAGDILDYVDRRFSIENAGARLCAERPGFVLPAKGDEILVLTAPPVDSKSRYKYRPSLIFPIQGSEVVYQPYDYVSFFENFDLKKVEVVVSGTLR